MPPTMILTVGVEEEPPLLAEVEPPELPPHAVRVRAIAPAAATLKSARLFMVDRSFSGVIAVSRELCEKWSAELRLHQMAGASERLGGRHFRSRCSRRLMRNSAPRVTTAMITMQAKTVFGSKVPWAWLMIRPMPLCAPSTSATSAPTLAKPKAVCTLAMIHVMAEGIVTCVATWNGDAPSTRTLAMRFWSTSRTPWNALKNTMKNTRTAASRIFGNVPRPNATMKIEPRMIRGIELTILMYGPATSERY